MIKEVEEAMKEKDLNWTSFEELATNKKSTNTMKRKFVRGFEKIGELNKILKLIGIKIGIIKNTSVVLLMISMLSSCTKEVLVDGCETCVVETISNERFVCGTSQQPKEVIATMELGEACSLQEIQDFIDRHEKVRSYVACNTTVFSNDVVKCSK